MGVLILAEGQYYKGDTINTGTIEGVVEEVGLRRTVLRDPSGTVHSISNGTIRTVSNLTRIYAAAVVDIPGVRQQDIEATIAVMNRVGEELAADPEWSDRILEHAALRLHHRLHGPGCHAADVRQGQARRPLGGARGAAPAPGPRAHGGGRRAVASQRHRAPTGLTSRAGRRSGPPHR